MAQSNSTPVKQRVLTILKWVFAVFFFIMALAMFKDKAFISILLLAIGGLLLLPPLTEFWRSKIPFLKNKFAKAGILFVLFVAGFTLNPNISKNTHKTASKEEVKELDFDEKKEILIAFIKEDKLNKSISNIKKLGEIGELFNSGNYATIHPHDGYISEITDSVSNKKILLFNPRFDFNERNNYLKNDSKKGTLKNYTMLFDIDNTGKIIGKKTEIIYSKIGKVIFENDSVPSYESFIDQKIVENQKMNIEAEQLIAKTQKEYEERKKAFEEKCLSSWDGSHRELVELVEKSMNDPKSFEHNETRYKLFKDYAVVIMSFRGKNAFGGTVLNSVTAKVSLDDCSVISVEQ